MLIVTPYRYGLQVSDGKGRIAGGSFLRLRQYQEAARLLGVDVTEVEAAVAKYRAAKSEPSNGD